LLRERTRISAEFSFRYWFTPIRTSRTKQRGLACCPWANGYTPSRPFSKTRDFSAGAWGKQHMARTAMRNRRACAGFEAVSSGDPRLGLASSGYFGELGYVARRLAESRHH
jgi:hypothetical protein